MDQPDQLRELFRMQNSLNERIGVHTDAMSDEQKTEWTLNYCRAMGQELAELTGIPVFTTMEGKSAFDERHSLSLGAGEGCESGPLLRVARRSASAARRPLMLQTRETETRASSCAGSGAGVDWR